MVAETTGLGNQCLNFAHGDPTEDNGAHIGKSEVTTSNFRGCVNLPHTTRKAGNHVSNKNDTRVGGG